MNATATVLDSMTRRDDLIKWAVRNIPGINREAFKAPQYNSLTAGELRNVIAALAEEANVDITVHDEEPPAPPVEWKFVVEAKERTLMGTTYLSAGIRIRDMVHLTVVEDEQRPWKKSRSVAWAEYVAKNDGSENPEIRDEETGLFARNIGTSSSFVVNVVDHSNESYYDGMRLFVSKNATALVTEGQHRQKGYLMAMENGLPQERWDEEQEVVITLGLTKVERRQQFSDTNMHQAKVTKSISLNFDQRDIFSRFIHDLRIKCLTFGPDKVATLKTRIGSRDSEWFTLSSVADAVKAMWDTPLNTDNYAVRLDEASAYWSAVAQEMATIWTDKTFIASNKNVLVAIGKLYGMEVDYERLACIDWSQDGDVYKLIREKGGTNAAVPAVYDYLAARVVKDKEE